MKRENYNSGWKHYKKGQQDTAFLVNLPHDTMQYEPPQPKRKFGGFGGGKTQVGCAHFSQLSPGA